MLIYSNSVLNSHCLSKGKNFDILICFDNSIFNKKCILFPLNERRTKMCERNNVKNIFQYNLFMRNYGT